jgi:endo-1,4-beta-xylanase
MLSKGKQVILNFLFPLAVLMTMFALGCAAEKPTAAEQEDETLAELATKHGLFFGAAANANLLANDPDFAPTLSREFNSLTPENCMKWGHLSREPGEYNFSDADAIMVFAQENSIRVRGHALFWSRLNGPPQWLEAELENADDSPAHLRKLMAEHVEKVVGRYRGEIDTWDVVNEPLGFLSGELDTENVFYRVLGEDYIAEAFELAHAADPEARLVLNETNIETLPGKAEGLVNLVTRLVDAGVPIDGVGIQGHFMWPFPENAEGLPDQSQLKEMMQPFADLGLTVEITELDISLQLFADDNTSLNDQAEVYAAYTRACLELEACSGITVWGISDGNTWLDSSQLTKFEAPHQPLLFDDDYQPKASYFSILSVLNTW